MASPQRPDPDYQSRRDFDQPKGSRPGRPPAGQRTRFLLWWLVGVLILAGIFWWIAWGWGNPGGHWWFTHKTPTQAITPSTTGAGLPALEATNKLPYIGKFFQVNHAPVQNKVNNNVYWIGGNGAATTLVILNGTGNSAGNGDINNGSFVDVTGTVQKAPPEAQAMRMWHLSSAGAARLEAQGAYVQGRMFLIKTVRNAPKP